MKWLLLSAALFLGACDVFTNECTAEERGILVTVSGAAGPAAVTVTARNLRNGRTQNASSAGDDGFFVGEMGSGVVRLTATQGFRTSEPVDTRWECDDCHCDAKIDGPIVLELPVQP